jgi:cell division initiation protein
MITPNDIQEKEFAKVVRGYKEDEVNAFLDLITIDMDKLIQENRNLKENIRVLNEDIERYKGSEGSIFETLETAKALMRDISASAEKRAEIVLKNAELEADRIQKDARESVERLHEEAASLTSRWTQFKTKYKNLLENEMERFEGLSADFLIDNEMEDLKILPEAKSEEFKFTVRENPSRPATKVSGNTTRTIKASKNKIGE